jgi:hypothetical protein
MTPPLAELSLYQLEQENTEPTIVAGFDTQQRYFFACWWWRFQCLVQFRQVFPERWPKHEERFPNDVQLGRWVTEQRKAITAGSMKPERLELLRSIGFPLDPIVSLDEAWWSQARALRAFRSENPDRWPLQLEEYPTGNRLGAWCCTQRQTHRDGKLEAERVQILQDMNFPFHTFGVLWEAQFERLKQYRDEHPDRWPVKGEEFPAGNDLGTWVCSQRVRHRHASLTPERRAKIDGLGVPWQVTRWEDRFDRLTQYRRQHPDCWPSRSDRSSAAIGLAAWMCTQRLDRKRGALSAERQQLLDDLGFPCNTTATTTAERSPLHAQ